MQETTKESTKIKYFVVQNTLKWIANKNKNLSGNAFKHMIVKELKDRYFDDVSFTNGGIIKCKNLKENYKHNSSSLVRDTEFFIKYSSEMYHQDVVDFIDETNRQYSGFMFVKLVLCNKISPNTIDLINQNKMTIIHWNGEEYTIKFFVQK